MLEQLSPFVGEWDLEVSLPSPDEVTARASFEWALDGRFLLQQHYFDTRGVVRVYAMTFEDGVWTLVRESPDFSELKFWQRYEGSFSADGDTIDGAWYISHDAGATWEKDFDLVYRRVR